MIKSILYSSIFIIAFGSICFFFFKSAVPIQLNGEYRVGSSYAYFSRDSEVGKYVNISNGSVSFYNKNSSGKVKNCNTTGQWTKKSDNVLVSGLDNSNCQEMSSFNAEYIIKGSELVEVEFNVDDIKIDSKISFEESKKFSFEESKKFMVERCRNTNQQLIKSFVSNFDGKDVYMFFTLSFDSPGYSCVSLMTPFNLEILSTDCNLIQVKVSEWNNIPNSPKIYL